MNLNQDFTQEGFFDIDLSSFESTETTEPTESTETVEPTETTEVEHTEVSEPQETDIQEVTEAEQFLEVRHLKENRWLTKEEAKNLSQMGLNYPRIKEKYDTLNNRIEGLARNNGLDVESFLNSLDEMTRNFTISQKVKELKELYPNSDEAVLMALAEKELPSAPAQPKNTELERQLSIFEKKYPNVDASKLDDEVYELMEEGYTLLEAYREVQDIKDAKEKAELERQEKIRKKNEENSRKALGSTSNVESVDTDLLPDFFR